MNTLITELQIYTDCTQMIKEAIILPQQTHDCPSSVTLALDFFLVILIFFCFFFLSLGMFSQGFSPASAFQC